MAVVRQSPHRPWLILPRSSWAELSHNANLQLDDQTLLRLRGIQDPTSLLDVREVYLPLTQLIELYRENTGKLYSSSNAFLEISPTRTPFVIGVAGSVAVGKSTTARLLAELLSRTDSHPKVALVPTDGFLYPNAELQRRGLMDRKGFPESYDRQRLLDFVIAVKSGAPKVCVKRYSHISYDIVADEEIVIEQPDILIVEGLNVLQPASITRNDQSLTISDFFDFSVYVDAAEADIRDWYVRRFMAFRSGAFSDPHSYFHKYSKLNDVQAIEIASKIWDAINRPNLRENIAPTRDRATAVLHKSADHSIRQVKIRKI